MLNNFLRSAAGTVLMAGLMAYAHALPPPPPSVATGFVLHASGAKTLHLPSNAKGVLFQAALPYALHIVADIPGQGRVLTTVPPPLQANQFSITGPDGRGLTPSMTRLDVDEVLGKTMRYFVARPGSACHVMAPACTPGYRLEEQTRWLKQGLEDGTLLDATEEVRRGVGLFRISPQTGMAAGPHAFAYRHAAQDGIPLSLPANTQVHIDEAAVMPDNTPLLLQPVGSPMPYFFPGPMLEYAALKQTLRYTPAARYGPYAALLTYATRARPMDSPASCVHGCDEALLSYWETPDTTELGMRCGAIRRRTHGCATK